MTASSFSDSQIVDSWIDNARPWTNAVREKRIESRKRVTDQAIIDAVLASAPRSVLDLGCGEGWLARELSAHGIEVTGIDVVEELVDAAHRAGGGDFRLASYDDLVRGELSFQVDALVCNFSLLGRECVDDLITHSSRLLKHTGVLIVQTLHPREACANEAYVDGWRAGTWSGFGADFHNPAPWYFRTLETWQALFAVAGYQSLQVHDAIHPDTQRPASVIFVAGDALAKQTVEEQEP